MSIQYTLTASHPEAHIYHVTLKIEQPDPQGQTVRLPVWIPGSYMVRDFAKNVVQISATSAAQEVQLKKIDKTTWRAPAALSELIINYDVYAWDLSVRTAHLDTSHGFFNGTSVFLAVEGQEDVACDVLLGKPVLPDNAEPWQVATSLAAQDVDDDGFGRYLAQDYDDLIDHPVEMGTFERATFTACGVPHEVVLTGRFTTDLGRICNDLKLICEHQIKMFGEPAPMRRYVFLVMVVGDGYGGLEHRASTSLLVKREHLPIPGEAAISDNYLEFLGLCSHEYFHTWNVKRIKPAVFVPYELTGESHTTLLWAFEGITSYVDDLTLLRTGLIDLDRYLTLLSKTITRVYRGAGRLKQSVADSSFDAWTKFYKQDENAPNAIVSYYAKGALVALLLDLKIREKTGGLQTLEDLMRILWQQWLATGNGVTERGIEEAAALLCGESLSEFFEQAVWGTDDLPLATMLETIGIKLHWRQPTSQEDQGGKEAAAQEKPFLWLGMRTAAGAGGQKITHIYDHGPAQKAGLAAGDTLVALNSLACHAHGPGLKALLPRLVADVPVTIHAFRRDELLTLPLVPEAAPANTCYLTAAQDHAALEAWLAPSLAKA